MPGPTDTAIFENAELRPLSEAEFFLFQRLVYREAGIWLSTAKKALVASRLSRRVRQLGLQSFRQYYRKIVEGDEAERVCMLDNISTNETHFFRERQHFDFLERVVFPRWLAEAEVGLRPMRLRLWCAGCSSGEEPYSIAMALLASSPEFSKWDIRITGTDISTRVLEKAKSGVWPIEKSREIPMDFLKRFMLKGVGPKAGQMAASQELRSLVEFGRCNLNQHPYQVAGPYDLIFCRNVLIYFDNESKRQVVTALLDCLAPDGYFFVGHSENLHLITDEVKTVLPTIYTRFAPERQCRDTVDQRSVRIQQ